MASIFPGMDPFLEDPAFWEDFRRRFITEIADYLLPRLPSGYDARMDQRIRLIEATGDRHGTRLPDVAVNRTDEEPREARPASALATLEPITLPMLELDEERDVWVEIVRLPERRLVTAIEVFSPTNKEGDGAIEYHNKRMSLYSRRVNLVEIDLLRGGQRLTFARPLPPGDYYSFVTRQRRKAAEVYAWSLRDALPKISVPLQGTNPDVRLDLAEVFNQAYSRGQYSRHLRYDRPLEPPPREQEAAWIGECLKQRS